MIPIVALVVSVAILGLTVLQTVMVLSYQSFLKHGLAPLTDPLNSEPADVEPAEFPKAAIVLCLRGADHSLVECLTGITCQDYPNYELHIVFDSEDDPAFRITADFFHKKRLQPKIHIFQPLTTCSLKCSAIIHAVERLSPDIKIVALIDADTVADQNWLADLATPLSNPDVGATTGNRWFSPVPLKNGSLVQKTWNAAAVVQMFQYKIAWGGSLAFRMEVIDQCKLLEVWSKTFCEDTVLAKVLPRHGMRLHRVHNLVLENNEPATTGETFRWMTRQLLTTRLHHTRWPEVLSHGLLTGLASIVTPILIVAFLVLGYYASAAGLFKAFLVYQVVNLGLLWLIGRSNRAVLTQREAFNQADEFEQPGIWRSTKAALMTQFLHPLATLVALFANQVDWRGVTYQISGKRLKVRKIEATIRQPEEADTFAMTRTPTASRSSLEL